MALSRSRTQRLNVRDANGPRVVDVQSGTHVELTQFTVKLQQPLAGDWRIDNGFRYRTSDTTREGFFPGSIAAGTARLTGLRNSALATFPTGTNVQFRYTTTPSVVFDPVNGNGNGLVTTAPSGPSTSSPMKSSTISACSKFLRRSDARHRLASRRPPRRDFQTLPATVFTDVRDNARLDLVAVNAAGAAIGTMTENGVSRYGSNSRTARAIPSPMPFISPTSGS
jgi:hypothetical protein